MLPQHSILIKPNLINKMTIGTALDDAMRRDFCINAMFYNLMTEQIEDLTQKGVSDLEKGIINTPLDAKITFHDDPLRILRAFRFASRFGFQLSENIQSALADQNVQELLRNKVTKERIGIELGLVLEHPSVFLSLSHYYNYKIFPVVFEVATE